ncbi:multicopper oxidase family protein [Cryobacterium sp. TMT1-62]|uniref:Multicopper oxidase family protein n=1 Tax=Cryobacterium sandaracinum TaxID=1259247 RepID=A0ABY2JIJ9_9MICO|nr:MULTISPECIES: multicopper oxidase family protein [Cryobacterium]TFC71683.1 multicopper oxidase family protein [Cryobacterium sp. TMT2-4]TFD06780.1 multicopper oxidase family protein [Cryobacterium sandaracinum]TFD36753.1 multicopper oxidase family protein [Cryobacterium sp. TMT1-62]
MKPLSRRSALTLGGLGLASTVAGGAGLLWSQQTASPSATSSGFGAPSGDPLVQPPELRSADGRLKVRLDAAPGDVKISGRGATVLSYNGGVPGPTLRVQAGDTLNVSLHNGLNDPSNLHVHGLHVSPSDNGDNMFVTVKAGESFDYEYQLPPDHPPGVYWYHPHHHGFVADQVFGGLYGAIIVEDPTPIRATRERVLVISDITLDSLGRIPPVTPSEQMAGREGQLVLVNGQVNPVMTARPGERERWRIVNACVSRYLRLRLDGQELQLLGIDSGRFQTPGDVDEVVLLPGNRADLLVTAVSGTSIFQTLPYDRGGPNGMMGGMMGGGAGPSGQDAQSNPRGFSVATLTVSGDAMTALSAVPEQAVPPDLRSRPVTARRELTFGMGMGGMRGGSMMSFTINKEVFDADRTDTTVQADSIEEWTLTNTSQMDHPLHLHVWPMQLVEENGRAVELVVRQDVVNVPAGGRVKVRIAFDDFAGRTVYHCHILDHEDNGMMGVIEAK